VIDAGPPHDVVAAPRKANGAVIEFDVEASADENKERSPLLAGHPFHSTVARRMFAPFDFHGAAMTGVLIGLEVAEDPAMVEGGLDGSAACEDAHRRGLRDGCELGVRHGGLSPFGRVAGDSGAVAACDEAVA
jgi:hypothetical protein